MQDLSFVAACAYNAGPKYINTLNEVWRTHMKPSSAPVKRNPKTPTASAGKIAYQTIPEPKFIAQVRQCQHKYATLQDSAAWARRRAFLESHGIVVAEVR